MEGSRGDVRASVPVSVPGTAPEAIEAALGFVDLAVAKVAQRVAGTDTEAMALVMLLHRVTNTVVYDMESTVHRPAGWSWSAWRALFTLWISGPLEPSRLAELSGMSRQAVSALAKTLEADGLIERRSAERDARSVVLSISRTGEQRLQRAFTDHNRREAEWVAALDPDERATLTRLLAKLADTAREPWVSHRY